MSYRILVVDDSSVSRKMVCRAVEMSGLDVSEILEAANGQEALDIIGKAWVDVILADVNMPVMSGAEMVAEMAKKGLMALTPVVMISSQRASDRIASLQAMGVRAYLSKPFRPEQIKQVVGDVLREKADDHG